MYTTTYEQLMKDFNCSQEVATLGLSFFIWGLGLFYYFVALSESIWG